ETVGTAEVVKEPVGVVACITPWNYPLHQVVLKVAPALAAGCTVVLKPSELAPLTAWILAEVINDVGLPAGVFNLVSGTGPVVGQALVSHPEVDMISFTGSTRAGRRISELASPSIKRVALELGGTRLGPLVSAQQQERVSGYIKKGIEEGAKLVTGGPEQPDGLAKGFFVKPTVFSGVPNDMTIAQEEIFGPVLSIIPSEDEDDA